MKKWSFQEIGLESGLSSERLNLYVQYMKIRWPEDEGRDYSKEYATEWANRFVRFAEYQCSDGTGKSILLNVLNSKELDVRICNKCNTSAKDVLYNENSWNAHDIIQKCNGVWV